MASALPKVAVPTRQGRFAVGPINVVSGGPPRPHGQPAPRGDGTGQAHGQSAAPRTDVRSETAPCRSGPDSSAAETARAARMSGRAMLDTARSLSEQRLARPPIAVTVHPLRINEFVPLTQPLRRCVGRESRAVPVGFSARA